MLNGKLDYNTVTNSITNVATLRLIWEVVNWVEEMGYPTVELDRVSPMFDTT